MKCITSLVFAVLAVIITPSLARSVSVGEGIRHMGKIVAFARPPTSPQGTHSDHGTGEHGESCLQEEHGRLCWPWHTCSTPPKGFAQRVAGEH